MSIYEHLATRLTAAAFLVAWSPRYEDSHSLHLTDLYRGEKRKMPLCRVQTLTAAVTFSAHYAKNRSRGAANWLRWRRARHNADARRDDFQRLESRFARSRHANAPLQKASHSRYFYKAWSDFCVQVYGLVSCATQTPHRRAFWELRKSFCRHRRIHDTWFRINSPAFWRLHRPRRPTRRHL